jgi:hypothetical protein
MTHKLTKVLETPSGKMTVRIESAEPINPDGGLLNDETMRATAAALVAFAEPLWLKNPRDVH